MFGGRTVRRESGGGLHEGGPGQDTEEAGIDDLLPAQEANLKDDLDGHGVGDCRPRRSFHRYDVQSGSMLTILENEKIRPSPWSAWEGLSLLPLLVGKIANW